MRHSLPHIAAARLAARRKEIALFLSSAALLVAAHILARHSPELYREWNKADSGGGLLEGVQAGLYFAALGLGVVAAFRAYRSRAFWPLGLFSVGIFFVLGDEIAWGQYLIGIPVPEFFLIHNHQRDMTLHKSELD
jgi:hypothetical protein